MEKRIVERSVLAIKDLYGVDIDAGLVQLQQTRKEFEGQMTLVVFPLLKYSAKGPEQTATELGSWLMTDMPEVENFNVVKGFLNLSLSGDALVYILNDLAGRGDKISGSPVEEPQTILVEYSSPNTNKPLHLGHIRNNLLGFSLSRILEENGHRVFKTNIVNDRGIHICKSMLAWKKFGNGETPESTGEKGDHLVGRYYVLFDRKYREEVRQLTGAGMPAEEAAEKASLIGEAREMLRKWEEGDKDTIALWEMMNGWVYDGFEITYRDMGVSFDKIYYESETFRLGRDIVRKGVEDGHLFVKEDGSVWADFSGEGLDEKLLLRSDGTAVYMTQDLGTAIERYADYKFDRQVYVVGNEQNYHFQVLKLLLAKLGYEWASGIHHFSYGMVELPEGKMKSREGTIVDADDLMATMISTARQTSVELGKLEQFSEEERADIYRKVGMGALKYFILKVDPKKNMMFNPQESIDFNGNTGPFIQYTFARINSILRKAESLPESVEGVFNPDIKELDVVVTLSRFAPVVSEAGTSLSPALIANYCYELAREFNQFYHDLSILGEEDSRIRNMRLMITKMTGRILERGMWLLGIDMPERM